MTTKWIKVPGPGGFRGTGEWKSVAELEMTDEEWGEVRRISWLPTREQDERPSPEDMGAP